jgi:hypothetical protein
MKSHSETTSCTASSYSSWRSLFAAVRQTPRRRARFAAATPFEAFDPLEDLAFFDACAGFARAFAPFVLRRGMGSERR